MSTTQEIESAIHRLPQHEQWSLLARFSQELWDAWDCEIKDDLANGRLDDLIANARADIAAGRTRPLNEILGDR